MFTILSMSLTGLIGTLIAILLVVPGFLTLICYRMAVSKNPKVIRATNWIIKTFHRV